MEYDFIDGYGLKTFLGNLNTCTENGWIPVWNTFKEEYNDEKESEYYCVILERKRKLEVDFDRFNKLNE